MTEPGPPVLPNPPESSASSETSHSSEPSPSPETSQSPRAPDRPERGETGPQFAEFFHTEELPVPADGRPSSHRGAIPLLSRLLPSLTAIVVVVVVIVLLIVINGHNPGHGTSPAAVSVPPVQDSAPAVVPSPIHSSSPVGQPTAITKPTTSATSATAPFASASAKATPKKSSQPKASLTAMAPVEVLNNSRRTGLAKAVAGEIHGRGWRITGTGNLQGAIAVPTVYYAAGDKAAAQHLKREFTSIQRVSPNAAAGLHGKGLTLVLTAAWAG